MMSRTHRGLTPRTVQRSRCRCAAAPRRAWRARLTSFDVDELQSRENAEALLRALVTSGAALLRLPPSDRLGARVAECYRDVSAFFARPFAEKTNHYAGAGVGQAHGYMDYLDDDEGSECFECKLHYDQRFAWPEGLRASVDALLDCQRRAGIAVLDALVRALGLNAAYMDSLLDCRLGQLGRGAKGDLATASHTAMRIWQYTHARPSGWHSDNTLCTLAPRGSAVGLQVRSPLDGQPYYPEAAGGIPDDSLLLFVGDALGYLTLGRVPALMHRVVPTAHTGRGGPRLSAPFFLRAKRGALLHPQRQSDEDSSSMAPLSVAALEHNASNLRSLWPWKRTAYYRGAQFHVEDEQCTAGR